MKKYELLKDDTKTICGKTLYRVRALVAFGAIAVGDLGGYIEQEKNLSHEGNAWVYGNAQVYGDAWVYGNAQVYGDAWVCGNAWVYGDAQVYGNAWVYGDAQVYGNAQVYGDAWVCGNASIIWFSNVGSENGTLTVCAAENGLFVSRGCFSGNDEEFICAVKDRHGADSVIGREYLMLIEVARSRISRGKEG